MCNRSPYPTVLEPWIKRAFEEIRKERGCLKINFNGGTFDPVHYGHLIVAQSAMEQMKSHATLWVPNGPPPSKPQAISGKLRVQMTKAATKSNPRFFVTSLEADRQTFSYTNDTLRQLREELGPDTEINLILGADNVSQLAGWKGGSDEIFKCCLLVAARQTADDDCGDDEGLLDHWRSQLPQATIKRIYCPMHAISSTAIRQLRKANLSIEYYLPAPVHTIIEKEGLYK